jgi:hypothetical protein
VTEAEDQIAFDGETIDATITGKTPESISVRVTRFVRVREKLNRGR